ncbi:MAG: helix-turn-helix domain-containing protein [Myxococcales bacterium]|nr:helix-turn-helix domain-containing protein [Myxococcales bacterium]
MVTSSHVVAPRLLTMHEVASTMGCSVRTVMRAIQRGELVATRIGRSVRVSVDDLRAYLGRKRATRGPA